MDVKKFYEAIAAIIAAREGVTIKVKSIKNIKKPPVSQEPAAMPKGI